MCNYMYPMENIDKVKRKRQEWSDTELDFLRENYVKMGNQFCAKELKRSSHSISHKVERMGLFIPRRKFHIEMLKNITDPEVAYSLGLFWADGSVSKDFHVATICNVASDLIEVEKFFYKTGEWSRKFPKMQERNRVQTCSLRCSNTEICKWLASMGYITKSKDSPSLILAHIPQNFHSHFWRGYFDGDGCLYVSDSSYRAGALSFSGSYEQDWLSLEELLKSLDVKYTIYRGHRKQGHSCSCLSVNNHRSISKAMEYLYRDWEGIGFSRKYKKWLDFQSMPVWIAPRFREVIGS